MGFYTREELEKIDFKSLGENIFMSEKINIYFPEKISIETNVRIDNSCILSGNINIGSFVRIMAYYVFLVGALEDFTIIFSIVTI